MVTTGVISAAIAAAVLLTFGVPSTVDAPGQTVRFSIAMPDGWTLFRTANNNRPSFAMSPDGQKLAVVLAKNAERRVFIRRLDETAFRELPGTNGANAVFWAPDSERLGFALPGSVFWKTDLNGTVSQQMAAISQISQSNAIAAWGPEDQILSGQNGGPLLRWSLANPVPTPVGELPKDVSGQFPLAWLPNGQGFLYGDISPGFRTIMVGSPSGAPRRLTIFPGVGFSAQYSFGHLLIGSTDAAGRSAVTAQPVDLATATLTGGAVVLAADAMTVFSSSDNGVLVTLASQLLDERFVWLDSKGAVQSTVSTGAELRRPINFDLSLDQRFMVVQQPGPDNPLLLHDLARGVTTTLEVKGTDPVWSPDGKQIAFAVPGGPDKGINIVPAFGGASRVLHTQAENVYLDDWSRDGQWLAGHVRILGAGILIPTDGRAKPIVFAQGTAVDETTFSPDGRWLAYNDPQAGEVYLTAVPPTGERWQVSVAGGAQPRWRADGKALYFLSMSGTMMVVDFQAATSGPPQIGAPRSLFETGMQVSTALDQYRVNAEGTRFLVRRSDQSSSAALNQLDVIVNWPGLLKKGG